MTERTLREQIIALRPDSPSSPHTVAYDAAICDALALLDAHTATQPAPDAVGDADAFDAFARWFRTNYPGPDTIIHKPDWHSPRIFRAVKYALTKGQQP